MMKYAFKKQVFQSVVQFFESQITKNINPLLLVKIIIHALNKHVPKFFHNARYSYFLAATLVLAENHLRISNAKPSALMLQYFEGFKFEEVWLIVYLVSKYEFSESFTTFLFNHLKSMDKNYYF